MNVLTAVYLFIKESFAAGGAESFGLKLEKPPGPLPSGASWPRGRVWESRCRPPLPGTCSEEAPAPLPSRWPTPVFTGGREAAGDMGAVGRVRVQPPDPWPAPRGSHGSTGRN